MNGFICVFLSNLSQINDCYRFTLNMALAAISEMIFIQPNYEANLVLISLRGIFIQCSIYKYRGLMIIFCDWLIFWHFYAKKIE